MPLTSSVCFNLQCGPGGRGGDAVDGQPGGGAHAAQPAAGLCARQLPAEHLCAVGVPHQGEGCNTTEPRFPVTRYALANFLLSIHALCAKARGSDQLHPSPFLTILTKTQKRQEAKLLQQRLLVPHGHR